MSFTYAMLPSQQCFRADTTNHCKWKKIEAREKEIELILLSGHSGYAVAGKDIVCAAVSSVVTTSINAILSFEETIKVQDDGNVLEIQVLKQDVITDTLLRNMLNLLKEIEKEYKKNIKMEGE